MKKAARRAVDAVSRIYTTPTAGLRGLPDFLIIGAQRCGTTSLYRYLEQHPGVAPVGLKNKGIHYFDTNFSRGVNWYRSHFPTSAYRAIRAKEYGGPVITGEGSPYYIFHPLSPARIAELIPDARSVLMLRDPVSRAHSHYQHEVARGFEELAFEDALRAEEERLAGEEDRMRSDPTYNSFEHQHHSYISRGMYVEQIRRWHALFPKDHLLILDSAEFFSEPDRELRRVQEFLGLSQMSLTSYQKMNAHSYGGMSSDARTWLEERFAAPNRALFDHLGHDLGWPTDDRT